jgi:hypothetical protein
MIVKIFTKHGELKLDKVLRLVVEDDYGKPIFVSLELNSNQIQLSKIGDEDFENLLKLFDLKSPKVININDLDGWKSLNQSGFTGKI